MEIALLYFTELRFAFVAYDCSLRSMSACDVFSERFNADFVACSFSKIYCAYHFKTAATRTRGLPIMSGTVSVVKEDKCQPPMELRTREGSTRLATTWTSLIDGAHSNKSYADCDAANSIAK